jgi:hypothetical protein
VWIKNPEKHIKELRGDQDFIRLHLTSGKRWQHFNRRICSFKVRGSDKTLLKEIPVEISVVCFHGIPRIKNAQVNWTKEYVNFQKVRIPKVTVIIPYKVDRGWLSEAVSSVPDNCQLLLSKGEGSWAQNFNKMLPKVTGDYVKFLHEDDKLTENCIDDSLYVIEDRDVDFIHGNAIDFYENGEEVEYIAPEDVDLARLLESNPIHGGSLMYKKAIFNQLGGFNENLAHAEEYEFNVRCLHAGFKLGFCDSFLYYYRRHSGQKSNVKEEELVELGVQIADKYRG